MCVIKWAVESFFFTLIEIEKEGNDWISSKFLPVKQTKKKIKRTQNYVASLQTTSATPVAKLQSELSTKYFLQLSFNWF